VWRWQTHLRVTSAAMALSLSKRKNIIDSRLISITYDVKDRRYYNDERVKFFSRFIEGSAPSLRTLDVIVDDNFSDCSDLDVFLKVGDKLESFSFVRATTLYRNMSTEFWNPTFAG
jgi:hypothetical protein